jgi:hypothetical protein
MLADLREPGVLRVKPPAVRVLRVAQVALVVRAVSNVRVVVVHAVVVAVVRVQRACRRERQVPKDRRAHQLKAARRKVARLRGVPDKQPKARAAVRVLPAITDRVQTTARVRRDRLAKADNTVVRSRPASSVKAASRTAVRVTKVASRTASVAKAPAPKVVRRPRLHRQRRVVVRRRASNPLKRIAPLLIALLAACAGGKAESDCRAVCDAHRNCVDSSTVAYTCESACKKHAGDDPDFEQQVSDCHDCLNKLTCEEFLVACQSTTCDGIPF